MIEECPAPLLPEDVRHLMHVEAEALLRHVEYRNAGTVEFLYDAAAHDFWFLEVNTRLQVEHGVTEAVFDVDLVEAMVRIAAGEDGVLESLRKEPSGHAIQARVYAEDPANGFRPTPGHVAEVEFPQGEGLRVDTWLRPGVTVSAFFDPMLAKVITCRPDRDGARKALVCALSGSRVDGIETNLGYLVQALGLAEFAEGRMTTDSLAHVVHSPRRVDVLEPGASTTVQAWPGRQGLWDVGVPPSGPMDDLSFRLGNRLLGNAPEAPGLEVVMKGPVLSFLAETSLVVTGPPTPILLDGEQRRMWETVKVRAGQTFEVGQIAEGARAYILIQGGFDVPVVLGSAATFTLGGFGGHNGRSLVAGDSLRLRGTEPSPLPALAGRDVRPDYGSRTVLRVLMGPHTAPDFFTDDDIETFLGATWKVHYNSSRTGVRLTGPQPRWARADGGEAGLHPSNLHDNAYAFGSVDFTGDMPVVLGPDGPSLGGFVCPAVVVNADRWKLGQLTPGDSLSFVPVDEQDAAALELEQLRHIETLTVPVVKPTAAAPRSPFLAGGPFPAADSDVVIRRAGQEWILVEFGPHVLDIELRMKVHALVQRLRGGEIEGIRELTAGIRSLQIRFDTNVWRAPRLVEQLQPLIADLGQLDERVPSRIVHLPLSWDDPACREATSRYQQGVRPDAPWCPDNIEFIRRINGLGDREAVRQIVYGASYLVMGLGDVYLGAPVATPLDPRHRLVTTKYNPARTWTAENSVGIGGSYMCIYGMEGPGGYQFVGRTIQIWDRYQRGAAFAEKPWLLRPFDQIRYFDVAADELLEMREACARGQLPIQIEDTVFDLTEYRAFLAAEAPAIEQFRATRSRAFEAELARWREAGQLTFESDAGVVPAPVADVPAGAVTSPMAGSVWSVRTVSGKQVERGETLLVLEAMKAEFEVAASEPGEVELLVEEGQVVEAGQPLAVVRAA